MLASWPVLLMHDLVGIGLLFLMLEIWQQWKAVWSFEPRWSRELARQRRVEHALAAEITTDYSAFAGRSKDCAWYRSWKRP